MQKTFVLVIATDAKNEDQAIVTAAELREAGYLGVENFTFSEGQALDVLFEQAEVVVIVGPALGDDTFSDFVASAATERNKKLFINPEGKNTALPTPRWNSQPHQRSGELLLGERVIGAYGPNTHGYMSQGWTRGYTFDPAGAQTSTCVDLDPYKIRDSVQQRALDHLASRRQVEATTA